jgi:hypothetical protein
MFEIKVLDKIKTHILCSVTFFRKSYRLWDNVEKYGTARQAADGNIIRRMRFACWITKATDTHSEYVILTAFPRQQWLRERVPMLRYTFLPCLLPLLFLLTFKYVTDRETLTKISHCFNDGYQENCTYSFQHNSISHCSYNYVVRNFYSTSFQNRCPSKIGSALCWSYEELWPIMVAPLCLLQFMRHCKGQTHNHTLTQPTWHMVLDTHCAMQRKYDDMTWMTYRLYRSYWHCEDCHVIREDQNRWETGIRGRQVIVFSQVRIQITRRWGNRLTYIRANIMYTGY